MDYRPRHKRLAAALRRAGVDSIFVSHLPNVRYLCGFSGSAGVLLVELRERSCRLVLFTDGRYTQQAKAEVQGAKVVITNRAALVEATEAASDSKLLGIEADHLPFSSYKRIAKSLRGKTRLKPLFGTIEELRAIKDPDEVAQVRAAVLLASSLFKTALTSIRPGATEAQVAGELELQARRAGAEKMSFDTIVVSGPRSAMPHGRPGPVEIANPGFIILDYGVILAGYCSDMTRTVHRGAVSRAHRRMYDAVREAQLSSIAAVRPGVEAGAVDQAGRDVLRKAGFGKFFTHSTGHGVGLEIHELPRIAKDQAQKLAPGMVITIEPGIYLPDDGGVRIEDMVLVTESGHEVLTPTPKDLITL